MTDREAFLAWFNEFHIEEMPGYQTIRDFSFAAWQAATAAERERDAATKDAERMREALTFYAEGDHFTFDRDATNAIHERESPTFMGEPVIRPTQAAPATDDRHAQELLAQDIALQNMAKRHAQELCAHQITVDKLRAERKPMTDDEMKTRFKITFTVTIDYEVNPENYPGCSTDEERLALDLKNAEDDPFLMISNDADWEVTGEIVKEGGAS